MLVLALAGAAGVGGSLIYAGLKTFLAPDITLYIQVVVPIVMFFTYILLLGKPESIVRGEVRGQSTNEGQNVDEEDDKLSGNFTSNDGGNFESL